ncbi:MAG: hypothetical protein HWN67_00130 [Candidatus Helarchaeota archaeon]|nr:hypothetical protein [Candidatus Helarchaeota archaeon]
MYEWVLVIILVLAIVCLVIGVTYLVWFMVHVSAGTRYSRKKAFIAVPIISLLLGFSVHFFLLYFGTGL